MQAKTTKDPVFECREQLAEDLGRKIHVSFRLSHLSIRQLDNLVHFAISQWQLSPVHSQGVAYNIANRSTILRQLIQDGYDAAIAQTTKGERMEKFKKKVARKRKR